MLNLASKLGPMRLLLGVTAAAAFLSPGGLTARAAVQTAPCTPAFDFTVHATAQQMGAVKARLQRDAQVVSFRFVTRTQALEQLRGKYPSFAKNLPYNPLPARIDSISLKRGVSPFRFIQRYAALLPIPGVGKVSSARSDGSFCQLP